MLRNWLCALLVALVLVSAPATARAGTISSDPATVTLTFIAFAGERNALSFQPDSGDRHFTDTGAPLVAGANCTTDAIGALCMGGGAVVLRLGDRDDRADVGVALGADVEGEEGDDELRIGSGSGRVRASGGPGQDQIRINVNGGGDAFGDDGDDLLTGVQLGASLWGVEGDDTLLGHSAVSDSNGGPGDDRLITRGNDATLDGGDGDDLVDGRDVHINIPPDQVDMAGGAGEDVLNGSVLMRDVVDAGSGDDRVHAWDGIADALDCGPGADTAFVDAMDEVASTCEQLRLAPLDALARLIERLRPRRADLAGHSALRRFDEALAQLERSRDESCYAFERLRSDGTGAICLARLIAAVRRLAFIPAVEAEMREVLAIERDMAIARVDEAAGELAPAPFLRDARRDIAAAAGDVTPHAAALLLGRVWQRLLGAPPTP